MFNPFFDASALTLQELNDKIDEISVRISSARTAGISHDIIQTMQSVIMACEDEIQQRAGKAQLDAIEKEKDNCVFDTESYLNSSTDKKNESTRKSIYKREW